MPQPEDTGDGTFVDTSGKQLTADEQKVIDRLRAKKGGVAAGREEYDRRHPRRGDAK